MTNPSRRPGGAPIRSKLLLAAIVGLPCTGMLAWFVNAWSGGSVRSAIAAMAAFAVVVAGMAATSVSGQPSRFGAANVVTTLRLSLCGVAAGWLAAPIDSSVAWLAVGMAVLQAVLDGVDGRLARREGASAFGARFDMETDAAFILVLSTLVWWSGKAGPWVLACGLMRYAFVGAGWVLPWMARPLTPTLRGKTVAVLQFAGLAAALAPPIGRPASDVIAGMTLAALVWSFALDVARLRRGDSRDSG